MLDFYQLKQKEEEKILEQERLKDEKLNETLFLKKHLEEEKLEEQKHVDEEKLKETLFAQKHFEEKEGNLALGIEPTENPHLIPCVKCGLTHLKGQCRLPY